MRVAACSLLRLLGLAATLALPAIGHTEYGRTPQSNVDVSVLAIDEAKHLGTPLDRSTRLVDEQGHDFSLADLLGKPVLLLLSYYRCDGACPTANRKLADALAGVKRFKSGADFHVLTASFDRTDKPQSIRHFAHMAGIEDRDHLGWRIALFDSSESIKQVTQAVGFRYFWSTRDRVFLHPNVLIALSPEGRVVRYLPLGSIRPRDIELALIESDWKQVANSARMLDMLTSVCFSYSYKDGRYVLNLPLFVAAGSLSVGLGAVVLSFSLFRKSRRKEALSA